MNHAKQARIRELHDKLHAQADGGILHLLNGQAMQAAFGANGLMREGDDYAPFNEAMCSGEATEPIFGEEFNRLRAAGHGVTPGYRANYPDAAATAVRAPAHSGIALWFGDDMFCQMNLLAALAYLHQTGYGGKLFFHMVKEAENRDEIEAVAIPLRRLSRRLRAGADRTPLPGGDVPDAGHGPGHRPLPRIPQARE